MIRLSDITIAFEHQTLFRDISLTLHAGEKAVIQGASGCGKSSLLKSVVGAIPLTHGSIEIDGSILSASTASDIRASIAFIGQEPVLGAGQVQDAIGLPFAYKKHKGRAPDIKTVRHTLERLRLKADILNTPCNRLSGGEKQRIAIARALLLGKNIFLADEVTSALDPESRQAVMQELFDEPITLLSVSHDPEWMGSCNRIFEICDANLQESGL